MPVSPIYSFMMDNVGGLIEFDVRPPEGEGQEPATWSTVSKTGPIDGRCPQTKPIRMLNCLGHLHIGAPPCSQRCAALRRWPSGMWHAHDQVMLAGRGLPDDCRPTRPKTPALARLPCAARCADFAGPGSACRHPLLVQAASR